MKERNCRHLKNMWRLREEERELMKDHPGWVVGTLYGEPLYATIDSNDMPDLSSAHFYALRPFKSAHEFTWPDRWD